MITELKKIAHFHEQHPYDPGSCVTVYNNNLLKFKFRYGLFNGQVRRLWVEVHVRLLMEFALTALEKDVDLTLGWQTFEWGNDFQIRIHRSSREAVSGVELQVMPYTDCQIFLTIHEIQEVLNALKSEDEQKS